jgi:hypothetical protein
VNDLRCATSWRRRRGRATCRWEVGEGVQAPLNLAKAPGTCMCSAASLGRKFADQTFASVRVTPADSLKRTST